MTLSNETRASGAPLSTEDVLVKLQVEQGVMEILMRNDQWWGVTAWHRDKAGFRHSHYREGGPDECLRRILADIEQRDCGHEP
jgi:hypothetical protein